MAGENLSYCGRACPECPVAHLPDGSMAVDNVYVQYGTEIDASTPVAHLEEMAQSVDAFGPNAVAQAIVRIETGNCPTAP